MTKRRPAPDAIVDPVVESWSKNAAAWAIAVRTGRIRSRIETTDAAILEAVLSHAPRRVLDLGCGEGWLCRALHAAGISDVVGIDATAELIEAARTVGPGTYLCADYDEIARRPARLGQDFDLVVANFALLDDKVPELLAALAAVVQPGGHLVIQTLHPTSADGPRDDGWRTETFAGLDAGAWAPMPYYARSFASWAATLPPSWTLVRVEEPTAGTPPRPVSLILHADRST